MMVRTAKGGHGEPHPIDEDLQFGRELTQDERDSLKVVLDQTAAMKGEIQGRLMREYISLAFDGVHVNGKKGSRSAITMAMKKIHSDVPEKVLEKLAGVSDQNTTVLQINFALNAVSTDPRVPDAALTDIFDPVQIPTMTEALPAASEEE